MPPPFEWTSVWGVGVALFLASAAFQAYGSSPADIMAREPAVRGYRDSMWFIVAGLLVAVGILQGTVTWFGLRNGAPWALPVLVLVGVALVAYWVLALWPYVRANAPLTLGDLPPFIWVPALLLVPATVCSWLGLR
jgi:hypothetical protein